MSLYGWLLADFLQELAGAKEPERADWLLVEDDPGSEAILVRSVP
jgi:hypothetical protein